MIVWFLRTLISAHQRFGGVGENHKFADISRFVSETVLSNAKVTIETVNMKSYAIYWMVSFPMSDPCTTRLSRSTSTNTVLWLSLLSIADNIHLPLLNFQCNVPLMCGSSAIAELLVPFTRCFNFLPRDAYA